MADMDITMTLGNADMARQMSQKAGFIAALDQSGGSTPKASDLAKGISTALFTTLSGLAIAIPAIAAFNILKNRIARLVLEVGITSEGLMSRFENVPAQK